MAQRRARRRYGARRMGGRGECETALALRLVRFGYGVHVVLVLCDWNSIRLGRPCAKIDNPAALGAERTKFIARFPNDRLAALRTGYDTRVHGDSSAN